VRTPVATYRVQLNHTFTFRQLQSLTPYFQALGISDCYCSPILTARRGSTHGYDICDHNQINAEIGSPADLDALTAALRQNDLGLIVDFVPNHMGIDPQTNAWWRDVLENGPSSPYARFFDIDWRPVKEELRDRVLLAILGDQYGLVLERGELQLVFADGALMVRYFDRTLPINPRRSPMVLGDGLDVLESRIGADAPDFVSFRDTLEQLSNMPAAYKGSRAAAARAAARSFIRDSRPHCGRTRTVQRKTRRAGEFRSAARAARTAGLSSGVLADRL
jgi:(1->4)-alpha-D-glucan 1-alpha-D-glucosylmutase